MGGCLWSPPEWLGVLYMESAYISEYLRDLPG